MKKSDKSVLLLVLGVVLALAAYLAAYKPLTAETEIMQKENAKLKQEVDRLQELANNKQQYLDDTAAMQLKIDEIIAQFPAQYLCEDEILYLIATEDDHDALAKSISMGTTTAITVEAPAAEAPVETGDAAAEEGAEVTTDTTATPEILLYKTPVTTELYSSYNSLKDVLKQINTDLNRKSVDTVSIAFDAETGGLVSAIAFSMYSLTGTEAEYTTPSVDGIVYGTNDIFNTVKRKAEADAKAAAQ
ncbi:MAG: hypothetical protein IJZ76_09030 [Lachnospiraceae bacterium]|nr:hypothetical protein [Lachnospiraceae bacterium]